MNEHDLARWLTRSLTQLDQQNPEPPWNDAKSSNEEKDMTITRTHPFAGSSSRRQSVGLPGHCEDCADVGHVPAHPHLGCGDVGCDKSHEPECCDHDETVNGICQDCGEQHGPITITLPLTGLPAECPHCGAPAPDGEWALGMVGIILTVVCPRCWTKVAPVRAIAGPSPLVAAQDSTPDGA